MSYPARLAAHLPHRRRCARFDFGPYRQPQRFIQQIMRNEQRRFPMTGRAALLYFEIRTSFWSSRQSARKPYPIHRSKLSDAASRNQPAFLVLPNPRRFSGPVHRQIDLMRLVNVPFAVSYPTGISEDNRNSKSCSLQYASKYFLYSDILSPPVSNRTKNAPTKVIFELSAEALCLQFVTSADCYP